MKPPRQETDTSFAEVIRMDPVTGVPAATATAHARTRTSRAHGLAIFGMALSALVATLALLAFITIRWPGEMGQHVKVVFVFSGVGFMACASLAVFFAMRDTHPKQGIDTHDPEP